MKKFWFTILLFASLEIFAFEITENHSTPAWGFYAHKLLNRLAVFTLPEDMIEFYKHNVSYLEEHAVDPDKRRYAIRGEAIRHYIDLDEWGPKASEILPRKYEEAIARTAAFYLLEGNERCLIFDTLDYLNTTAQDLVFSETFKTRYTTFKNGLSIKLSSRWINESAMPYFDEKEWIVPVIEVQHLSPEIFKDKGEILIQDRFSKHGIIPYSLPKFYSRLVNAFKEKNAEKILKLSADIGHYIGDAHVPLHTTKNYNGQLTNQDGIHAFWESRIPELFAEPEFDFVVGQAEYIVNIDEYVWKIVRHAHSFVDSVLLIEKRLSEQIPNDQQYCFESRLGIVTKLACKDYASLYHKSLDYQVEEQFRSSILTIGSFWMSAWTDAGQPNLSQLNFEKNISIDRSIDSLDIFKGKYEIRQHE